MIYTIGHKNPDTDSVVSAIVMADYLKKRTGRAKALAFGKIGREAKFVLKKAGSELPSLTKNLTGKKVFLVDHNELSQAAFGIEKAEIVGIIDHHKLGGISTKEAIHVRIEPIGSTSTLIFKFFLENNFKPNKKQAFLLLAGIISDTLNLTSPTTTKEDKDAVKFLSKNYKIDAKSLSKEMFKVRSDISGVKVGELIVSDYKEFKEKNIVFGFGVYETLNPQALLEKKNEVFSNIEKIKKEKKLDLLFFGLVDIFKKE